MEKNTEIIVGTASTFEIAKQAIEQHSNAPYEFIANSDETELSLLRRFQQMDDPHPVIVQTEAAVSVSTGLKRVRGFVYLYAVAFLSPSGNEKAQIDIPMAATE